MGKEACSGRAEVQIRLCIHNGETQNGSDLSFFSSIIPGLVRAVMAPSCSAFSVSPCIGGPTCVGYGCILQLVLPHFQGGIPILTIKQHLYFVFTAPSHAELSWACITKAPFIVRCLWAHGPWLKITGQSLLATVSCWIFPVLYSLSMFLLL